MKLQFFTASITLALALTFFGCESGVNGGGGKPSTPGGGVGGAYDEVVIGSQIWMKRNLNVNVSGSKCYENKMSNCDKYGRLYTWSAAMSLPSNCSNNSCSSQIKTKHQGICPAGWHIPSKDDWETLSNYVEDAGGCYNCDAELLKASSGWSDGNGLDDYGFTALPAGTASSGGEFFSVGYTTSWWSATENSVGYIYHMAMNYDLGYSTLAPEDKTYYLRSVRCIKN